MLLLIYLLPILGHFLEVLFSSRIYVTGSYLLQSCVYRYLRTSGFFWAALRLCFLATEDNIQGKESRFSHRMEERKDRKESMKVDKEKSSNHSHVILCKQVWCGSKQ